MQKKLSQTQVCRRIAKEHEKEYEMPLGKLDFKVTTWDAISFWQCSTRDWDSVCGPEHKKLILRESISCVKKYIEPLLIDNGYQFKDPEYFGSPVSGYYGYRMYFKDCETLDDWVRSSVKLLLETEV